MFTRHSTLQRLDLSELSLLPPFLSPVQAFQDSALRLQQLSLYHLPERRDFSPFHGLDCHLYNSPKPKVKFTIFLPESACPLSSWPHSVTCTIILLLGQLQMPTSFLNLYSFLPSISLKPLANVSFSLSSRHTWPLVCALN